MNEERQRIEHLRGILADLMRTLPRRMVDFSIERGRQAKAAYPKAEKVVKKPNPTDHELHSAINLLR